MARQKKIQVIEQIKQTNGALPAQEKTPVKSVYDIIGQRMGGVKYQTLAEYKQYLDTLNLSELQKHAIETVNIIPIDDRRRLTDRLEKEFLQSQNKYTNYQPNRPLNISQENQDNLLKILNSRT
jgi:hypothetical protein